jgi:hypothetical protein
MLQLPSDLRQLEMRMVPMSDSWLFFATHLSPHCRQYSHHALEKESILRLELVEILGQGVVHWEQAWMAPQLDWKGQSAHTKYWFGFLEAVPYHPLVKPGREYASLLAISPSDPRWSARRATRARPYPTDPVAGDLRAAFPYMPIERAPWHPWDFDFRCHHHCYFR